MRAEEKRPAGSFLENIAACLEDASHELIAPSILHPGAPFSPQSH